MEHDISKLMEEWAQKQREQCKQAKVALFAHLVEHHPRIAHIKVCYDGYGDEGNVSDIAYFDKLDEDDAGATELTDEHLVELIDDLFCCVTPGGFENNDGGDGEIHIYPATQKVIVNHNQNVVHQEHESYEA